MSKRICIFLLLLTVNISFLAAQIIKGRVLDENGEPIASATVVIQEINKGTTTDNDGKFRFKSLPIGQITVIASFVGYQNATRQVRLSENSEAHIQFEMEPNAQLREIEVFGERHIQPDKLDAITRMPLRPSEQIQSISIISEKVIAEQGALTLTEAVRNVAGVTLFGSYGGTRESLSSRGYRALPVLKNGVRVDSDFRTASLLTDMEGVESVQVIKGSAAITQGLGNDLGSPGGVVNVVTKTPKFVNGGEVAIRTGSWGQFRPTFDVQQVLDKNGTTAFRVNGAYDRADSFRKQLSRNSIYINPSFEWRPDSKTSIILEMDYYHDSRTPDMGTFNLAGDDVEALYKMPHDNFLGFSTDRTLTKVATYAARLNRDLGNNLHLRAAYFAASLNTDNASASLEKLKSVATTGEYNKRQRTLGGSLRDDKNSVLQVDLIGKDVYTASVKHTFQVGFDYKATNLTTTAMNSLVIDTIDILHPIVNTLPSSISGLVAQTPLQSQSYSYGVMAQEVMTINEYAKAILGLRYSYTESKGDAYNSTTKVTTKGATVVSGDAWNPMVGMMISPIKNMNLFGSYTTTTSLRSASNLMADGNPIGSSKSKQWEFGVKSDWLNNRLRFNFTYFHILNSNTAYAVYDEAGKNVLYYDNAGDIVRQGVETELTGRILPNLQVILGYAYLDAQYRNSPAYEEGSAPMNAPKHTANGWTYYTLDRGALKGLSIGVGAYYVGARPVNEFTKKVIIHNTDPGVKPFDMPAYTTVNVQLAYNIGKVTARVFFNNIFDELGYNSYYRGGYINQIDPRNFAGVLSYNF